MRWISAAFAVLIVLVVSSGAAPKKPVFVGSQACAQCHEGAGAGHQYSKWLLSKHSMAYSVLARPESIEIARISGLREHPQQAPICLGCHSTAFNAEDWEKDESFRGTEGVQCENCHGPGSEYMEESVMRNPQEAMKAGLRKPTEAFCLGCHIEKGSHTAVLKNKPIDIKTGLKEIAHPHPSSGFTMGSLPKLPEKGEGRRYAGSSACGSCHKGEMFSFQFSKWRMSPHARAYATLVSPKAAEYAKAMGVDGEPQKSEKCLGCHATAGLSERRGYLEGFNPSEGVGCESCHGAGADYMNEAVMRDNLASRNAGLNPQPARTCNHCHAKAHGKPFDAAAALRTIAHPTKTPPPPQAARYKTPLNLAFRPASKELWAALEAGDAVAILDSVTRKKIAEIPTGAAATEVAFTPDGKRAFVSNRAEDSVTVIDAQSRKVLSSLKAGDEPHGVIVDKAGKYLYILNTSSDDITVYDAQSLHWVKKLTAGRAPWSLALSPDGTKILATNMYSHIVDLRKPLRSEVTVIDAARGIVDDRWMVPDTNLMMGVAWHPSGQYALATMNRTKNLVPMTRLMQGWTITNGLAVMWKDGRVDEVLLDQPGFGFADATDVAFTPDGRYALVTSSGTDRVALVDCLKLTTLVRSSTDEERRSVLPNHLGKSAQFIVKYFPTGFSPRGVAVAPDGSSAFVANSISDSITVIDLRKMEVAGAIDLEGPKEITKARYGERLFHNAGITFRRQFACHSCHPDGHVDQLAYDIEADGVGVSPVDNRTLRGILDTAPFKWEGTNPSLSRQCGARLSVFFTRIQPFDPEQLSAVDHYITTIQRPPNRYRPLGAQLTPAQRRGKVVFERTTTNDGRAIPPEGRCISCHFPPYYTSRQVFDVGTRHALDRTGKFDVPHLNNIYDSAPYLHNGMAATLEEIWTVYNPYDKHGFTNDMTKDQLNDLIEYLKTL